MYRIRYDGLTSIRCDLEELIKVFLPGEEFTFVQGADLEKPDLDLSLEEKDKNQLKRWIYQDLSQRTGYTPAWGILTGVRPVKIVQALAERGLCQDEIRRIMKDTYLIQEEKLTLLLDTLAVQQTALARADTKNPNAVALYVGIPFCPTRCHYCSFPSNTANPAQIRAYMDALMQEIKAVSGLMKKTGYTVESLYVGGGTPTHLEPSELEELLGTLRQELDLDKLLEFTVEAGRPDTITEEKLRCIRRAGADRISINPQTMNPDTLRRIGRSHTPEQIRDAFQMARSFQFPVINADLIAGLPLETVKDFEHTLSQLLAYGPENITVHTLATKRASLWKVQGEDPALYRSAQNPVSAMVDLARTTLQDIGYGPYYLYRQKQMTGNLENVGYALPGTENLYNIRIMEERQTIVACGAGGISKLYVPEEDRLERIANVSNYQIYVDRIEEMIERKQNGLFRR